MDCYILQEYMPVIKVRFLMWRVTYAAHLHATTIAHPGGLLYSTLIVLSIAIY